MLSKVRDGVRDIKHLRSHHNYTHTALRTQRFSKAHEIAGKLYAHKYNDTTIQTTTIQLYKQHAEKRDVLETA